MDFEENTLFPDQMDDSLFLGSLLCELCFTMCNKGEMVTAHFYPVVFPGGCGLSVNFSDVSVIEYYRTLQLEETIGVPR